ncbi:hypothetical protein DFH94DRAFT_224061 [Russula ochroleuca]|jgi:hypothetical protein|uniref:Uncharacterized protein n=1 Tax=Russula ochroleuca TaxID=152965 RepID=A0A9P5MQK6_9AGAM|nr:hypothetical protein DFH94DRAFT_224061 [Russula ochroleuca]
MWFALNPLCILVSESPCDPLLPARGGLSSLLACDWHNWHPRSRMTCRVCSLLPRYDGEASTRAHITYFCFSLIRACLFRLYTMRIRSREMQLTTPMSIRRASWSRYKPPNVIWRLDRRVHPTLQPHTRRMAPYRGSPIQLSIASFTGMHTTILPATHARTGGGASTNRRTCAHECLVFTAVHRRAPQASNCRVPTAAPEICLNYSHTQSAYNFVSVSVGDRHQR